MDTNTTATTTTIRNASLQDLADMLRAQQVRKLDVVAPATKILSHDGLIVLAGTDAEITDDGVTATNGAYRPTGVFDEHLAAKLSIPLVYLRRLRATRPDILDANVNGWLHGDTVQGQLTGRHYAETAQRYAADTRSFLVRTFRGDDGQPGIARALLSDRYGIVDHLDVLTAALDGVRRAGVNVHIDGCDLTDRRMYVRVVAPEVAALAPEILEGYRSPFTGQTGADNPVVWAGFVISNSETGEGAFTLTPRLVVQVCHNGLTISKDAMRGVHLGSRMTEGVIRWSRDTERRTLELVTARTRDAVRTFLDVDYVKRKLAEIREHAAAPVADAAKTIEIVAKRLTYTQEQHAGVLDHFIRGGQMTAGGVLHAVTAYAQTVSDADTAHALEESALRALDVAATAR